MEWNVVAFLSLGFLFHALLGHESYQNIFNHRRNILFCRCQSRPLDESTTMGNWLSAEQAKKMLFLGCQWWERFFVSRHTFTPTSMAREWESSKANCSQLLMPRSRENPSPRRTIGNCRSENLFSSVNSCCVGEKQETCKIFRASKKLF